MGCRRDQRDQVNAILPAYRIELFFLFKRHVRKDQPVHPRLFHPLYETLCSVGKYDIRIRHKHKGNL